MKIELDYSAFFGAKSASADFEQLLLKCVKEKKSLSLTIGIEVVEITVVDLLPSEPDIVRISGHWRSSALAGDYQSRGALVLLPFLFMIVQISLPYKIMYTYGRGDRSIADFFLRNYLFSALRGEIAQVSQSVGSQHDKIIRRGRDLMRRYLWIVKALVGDDIFSKVDVAELIVANSHAPIFKFSKPMLEKGASECRQVVEKFLEERAFRELKSTFHKTRERMMLSFKV